MTNESLRFGVAGLGRGFMLTLPAFMDHPRVKLVAAADPRADARERFEAEFAGRTYDSTEALCSDPDVDVVYVATPHQLHAAHTIAACAAGKHVLVEKPMALSLAECRSMIDAAQAAGVHLIVGPSHSFDAPIAYARRLIDSGNYGRVRMITSANYTDFLYRPRRPEELETGQGGGVVFSQAVHQIDVVRRLAAGRVRSVRAQVGAWDSARPTEGAYAGLVFFEDGAVASVMYSGYAHFDTDELCDWITETGFRKDPQAYGEARRLLFQHGSRGEAALKSARAYGAGSSGLGSPGVRPQYHEHFGLVIVSCEAADLRPTPKGVFEYGHEARRFHPLDPPDVVRSGVIDEVVRAVAGGEAPLHDGRWGMATMEACLAMLQSGAQGREVTVESWREEC